MRKLMKPAPCKSWAAIALLAAVPCLALAGDSTCSVRSLKGLYLFSGTGFTIPAGVALPKAILELIDFNGDGTLAVPGATRSINGDVAQIPPGGTGVYTLDPDCTGTITFSPFLHLAIYMISPKELALMQTDANNVFQGSAKAVRP
jgi:hypothetical protein